MGSPCPTASHPRKEAAWVRPSGPPVPVHPSQAWPSASPSPALRRPPVQTEAGSSRKGGGVTFVQAQLSHYQGLAERARPPLPLGVPVGSRSTSGFLLCGGRWMWLSVPEATGSVKIRGTQRGSAGGFVGTWPLSACRAACRLVPIEGYPSTKGSPSPMALFINLLFISNPKGRSWSARTPAVSSIAGSSLGCCKLSSASRGISVATVTEEHIRSGFRQHTC